MLQRIQGILFALIGIASVGDAWRVSANFRETANFDAIGPDRYLMIIGSLMILCGVMLVLKASSVPAGKGEEAAAGTLLPDFVLAGLGVAGFALLMPYAGFTLTAFIFFLFAFTSIARWPWIKVLTASLAAAALLHLTFITFADVPLPQASLIF